MNLIIKAVFFILLNTSALFAIEVFDSAKGQAILNSKSTLSDLPIYTRYMQNQQNLAFCGVASSVIVLNSLGIKGPDFGNPKWKLYPFFTQDNVFTTAFEKIIKREEVRKKGMTLAQLSKTLSANGADTAHKHGSEPNFHAEFEKSLLESLGKKNVYILVNYHRKTLGQDGGGHISPIAAFNPEFKKVLILDVASYRYPPVWVDIQKLTKAMKTNDSTSGKMRGFVVIKNKK